MTGAGVIRIDEQRLLSRLDALAALTEPQRPYTRRAFTSLHAQGREWLKQQMQEAGLTVHLDDAGNLIGRREGRRAHAQTLMLGSHTDTVVGGGRYDGMLGVLAALEVAQVLFENGTVLEHALEIVDFLSEEPSDYGCSCVGSRGLAGTLTPALLAGTNAAGETLAEAMIRAGARPERLTGPQRSDLAAYLELHIEQGPVLEHAGVPLGVVSGIVGIERYELTFSGQPDHAGTTPMTLRRDALVAAARCIDELHRQAFEASRHTALVATTGQLRVHPNNSNVVPGEVVMGFEARTQDAAELTAFTTRFIGQAGEIAERLGVALRHRLVSRAAPLHCDPRIQQALRETSDQLGFRALTLPSGAGHDAMQVGLLAPAGMLFVPSVAGRSHCPEEFTPPADLLAGAQVMLHTTLRLDKIFAPSGGLT